MKNATFTINEVQYTWNARLADLEDAGWNMSEEDKVKLSGQLSPHSNAELSMKQNGYDLQSVEVYNPSEDTIPLEEGLIRIIHCTDPDVEKTGALGINKNMSYEEADALLKKNHLPYGVEDYGRTIMLKSEMKCTHEGEFYSMILQVEFEKDTGKYLDSSYSIYEDNTYRLIHFYR